MRQPLVFTEEGLLPLGDHPLTLDQLAHSILVTGPERPEQLWDVRWRMHLVSNLAILVRQLWQVGIERICIDGSFVEEKAHPNDIDGYFECGLRDLASGRLERALNELDPYRVWTWHPASRRAAPDSAKKQLPMWHQ